MSDWDDFGFEDLETPYKRDLTDIGTEELVAELASRRQKPVSQKVSSVPVGSLSVVFPRPETPSDMTMGAAWEQFDLCFTKGMFCPCCDLRVQLYPRSVYGAVAVFLLWLVVRYREEARWYHVNEAPLIQNRRGGGDKDKLKLFGLAEEKPNHDDPKKRSSGFWRPTKAGIDFADGKITISEKAWTFNSTPLVFSDKHVTIHDVLGKKYDYAEVIGNFKK